MSIELLREYIQSLVNEDFEIKSSGDTHVSRHLTAAGFVVLRKIGEEYKVLGLLQQGQYDLPKGHIERDEAPIEAAFRETREESDITRLTFNWGLEHIVINDRLVMYVAVTNQDGKVVPNPDTGIYEHEEVHWLSFEEIEANCLDYLLPAILWAKTKLYEITKNPKYRVTKADTTAVAHKL